MFFVLFGMLLVLFCGVVAAERVGTASFGYVDKEVYGNLDSNVTVVVVTGMHPLESGSHEAMTNKLKTMPPTSNKRYIHYSIHVTKNPNDYNIGRMNGQLLAEKFIVPDVEQYNPVLVVDIHENRWKDSGYKYDRFLYPILPTNLTNYYTDYIIGEMPFLVKYNPPNPTSPPYMAVPIATKGIPMIIYENYMYDPMPTKNIHMEQLVNTLDTLKPAPENTTTTHTLTNTQYKELWKRINKFQKDKGRLPNYVVVTDMHVGVDQITKDQYNNMKCRWEAYKAEHDGREPQIIEIERKTQHNKHTTHYRP